MADQSRFILPNDIGICLLECQEAFKGLTDKEKLYAHYLAQASWYGSLACLYQTSPESPGIFLLLQKLFRQQNAEELRTVAKEVGLSEDEYQAFLVYCAGFYSNLGNYKSFGDTKFIPNLEQAKFEKLILQSAAYQNDPEGMQTIWVKVKDALYSLSEKEQQLGLGSKGITTYFSANCDKSDAEIAQHFMNAKKLSAYNTRLFKYEEDGDPVYEIRLASAKETITVTGDSALSILGNHTFTPEGANKEVKLKVTRGDYAPLMARVCDNLKKAKEYAANSAEVKMLDEYIICFSEGSIEAHKQGSRHWIHNKGPVVETYIGFIESYRDPYGVRGEFEGFVAMVNKEMSAKFSELVNLAEHFLPLLPWPTSYEKDKFLRPDFTSLDVLAFGSSGIPAGINIPNYDDIRQTEGFKNVSLGNVLFAGYKDTKITFLDKTDQELYAKWKIPSFEVQVGIHELLGHGSGKLFTKNEEGKFNFDIEHVLHTETEQKITSWYEAGETWTSKFQSLSQPYEECRAECVGIYLCLSSEILKIFGHEGCEADDIIYINWLNMARAGLLALEFYSPDTQTWGQAHMQARYVILRVLLEAGDDFVMVEKVTGSDGNPDIVLHLDRSKISSVGKPAIGHFLRKLQVYKATADVKSGREMFEHYSAVMDNEKPHFLSLREIVLKRKQPRKMFVQCNTFTEDSTVSLKQYSEDATGLIQSVIERFPDPALDVILQNLWTKDLPYFL